MESISFKNGTLTVKDKKTAIVMAFSQSNAESDIYNKVEKSLPIKNGLKRKYKRVEFAFDLIDELNKNGITLSINEK